MTENSGQLKEAIEVLKKLHNWLDYGAGELEPTANTVMEAIDTVIAELEKELPAGFRCPCCGSDMVYLTQAAHCTMCAVTTEL